jgi:hypothetical protein
MLAFWEQRGLAASGRGRWDLAESYAERAVALHEGAFTLNTLGVILLRKALETTLPGAAERMAYFERAVRALEDSRQQGRDRFMHPYVTFFEYTLRLALEHRQVDPRLPPRMVNAWGTWAGHAQHSNVFQGAAMRAQLDGYSAAWFQTAV